MYQADFSNVFVVAGIAAVLVVVLAWPRLFGRSEQTNNFLPEGEPYQPSRPIPTEETEGEDKPHARAA